MSPLSLPFIRLFYSADWPDFTPHFTHDSCQRVLSVGHACPRVISQLCSHAPAVGSGHDEWVHVPCSCPLFDGGPSDEEKNAAVALVREMKLLRISHRYESFGRRDGADVTVAKQRRRTDIVPISNEIRAPNIIVGITFGVEDPATCIG